MPPPPSLRVCSRYICCVCALMLRSAVGKFNTCKLSRIFSLFLKSWLLSNIMCDERASASSSISRRLESLLKCSSSFCFCFYATTGGSWGSFHDRSQCNSESVHTVTQWQAGDSAPVTARIQKKLDYWWFSHKKPACIMSCLQCASLLVNSVGACECHWHHCHAGYPLRVLCHGHRGTSIRNKLPQRTLVAVAYDEDY